MTDPMFLVAAVLLGAVVGSFLNVVIFRLPRPDRGTLGHRSVCCHCGARIPAWLNVPVLAWVWLRGRAKCCGGRIGIRYPLVELLTALLFGLLAAWPPSGTALDPREPVSWIAFAFHAYLVANLIANTFIDFDHRILPDALTKPLMAVGVIGSFLLPGAVGGSFRGLAVSPAANSLMYSLFGLVVGLGLTWTIRAAARVVFAKEAMGLGDVKLMGGIGAYLGWDGALLTFFLGCVAGAIGGALTRIFTRDPYVAFGPYLALGAVVTLFAGDPIVHFLTVSWPEWQVTSAASPWVLGVAALFSLFLLMHLVRRGRSV